LGCIMRELFGMGTPRGLQKAAEAFVALLCALYLALRHYWRSLAARRAITTKSPRSPVIRRGSCDCRARWRRDRGHGTFSTGCERFGADSCLGQRIETPVRSTAAPPIGSNSMDRGGVVGNRE